MVEVWNIVGGVGLGLVALLVLWNISAVLGSAVIVLTYAAEIFLLLPWVLALAGWGAAKAFRALSERASDGWERWREDRARSSSRAPSARSARSARSASSSRWARARRNAERFAVPSLLRAPLSARSRGSGSGSDSDASSRGEPARPARPHGAPFDAADLALFTAKGDDGAEPCPICFEDLSTGRVAAGPCAHIFHATCIKGWLARGNLSCPCCREHFDGKGAAPAVAPAGRGLRSLTLATN